MDQMLLAGDIGGTKTRLGLFQPSEGPGAADVEAIFPSQRYQSLEAIVREFLAQNHASVGHASFGVAGPVIGGRAKITNLPWVIDQRALSSALRIPHVNLLNDLEAIATSVPHLGRSDYTTLNQGRPDPRGCLAVIAPGTGLGEAFLTREGQRYSVHPSEGGHGDFAPRTPSELELLRELMLRMDHVSYEDVCSGLGIRNIHAHLARIAPDLPRAHAEELEAAEDPIPLIAKAALGGGASCKTCARTFEMFTSILGAEAGNLALKVLATGGVYVGGGIPPKTLPLMESGTFMESFTKKGRMSEIMSNTPVHVITNPKVALLGAARSGAERMNPGVSEQEMRTR